MQQLELLDTVSYIVKNPSSSFSICVKSFFYCQLQINYPSVENMEAGIVANVSTSTTIRELSNGDGDGDGEDGAL